MKAEITKARWPALLSRAAARQYLDLSQWKFDELVRREELVGVMVDSITMFRRSDLDSYIESLPSANARHYVLARHAKAARISKAGKKHLDGGKGKRQEAASTLDGSQ